MIFTLKGKQAIEVSTLEEAVAVCAKFRDTCDYGSGIGSTEYYAWRVGRVLDANSKKIAQIHYNGRIESNVKAIA